MTTTPIRIDFVSDVSCPWCAIGLNSLEVALSRLGDSVQAQIHFQPFELNPHMVPEGQDITEHLRQKYGASPAQQEQTREMIRQRGADVGFDFAMGMRSRIYNTFDAHRLLHWAGEHGKQKELKKALFDAYCASKKRFYAEGGNLDPWGDAMKGDPIPFGLTAKNREIVQTLLRYLHEQKFIKSIPKIDHLFVEGAERFADN